MPRARSIAIQSDVTPRRPALPCTAPAWVIADACRARASVRVDLPASGWLITANARRLGASAAILDRGALGSHALAPAARGSPPVSATLTYVRILGPWTAS